MDISPLLIAEGGQAVHCRVGVIGMAETATPLGSELAAGWLASGVIVEWATDAETLAEGFGLRSRFSAIPTASAKYMIVIGANFGISVFELAAVPGRRPCECLGRS
jgi:hypothetical protein